MATDWREMNEARNEHEERFLKAISESDLEIKRRLDEAEHKEQEDAAF